MDRVARGGTGILGRDARLADSMRDQEEPRRVPEMNPGSFARPIHGGLDHPPVRAGKIGVVIANLGTPDATGYWPMRRYLGEFLSDRRVIDYSPWFWQPLLQLVILTRRPFSSGNAYRLIWNRELDESPLLTTTRNQAHKLAEAFAGDDRILVDFCMRYGNPSTENVLRSMCDRGCTRILFFPLYPQYSATTTATAIDQAFRALMTMKWQPAFRSAPPYHDHPLYINALANSVRKSLGDELPDALVLSYHGLPERYLTEGDPYHCHCQKTSRLLTESLGWPPEIVRTCFQSRFGSEEWLKPYTVDEVSRLAKGERKRIAVLSPGFAADCVETLEEVDSEIREAFQDAGGTRFSYIPCLNDSPDHIRLLADIVTTELSGWI